MSYSPSPMKPLEPLKPCPFCGGPGKIYEQKYIFGSPDYMAHCLQCRCRISYNYDKKVEAVAVWNTRAKDQ